MPHAVLFVGPPGVGKATAARILGQRLLCIHAEALEPCGVCGSCGKAGSGLHADFHHLTTEGRSLKIGDLREMTARLQLRPVEGTKKVLLIEDSDRLTLEAQNALLKTLEEPPGQSHLILTTTRLKALLPTVVSRCPQIRFSLLPLKELQRLLEDRAIPAPEALVLAGMSQGSLGRALSFDYAAVGKLRDDVVAIDCGLWPNAPKDDARALLHARTLSEDREKMGQALDLLLVWLRDQMLVASCASSFDLANQDRLEELKNLAQKRGLLPILDRARAVLETKRRLELPYNFNPQMLAEELCLHLAGHVALRPIDR